MRELTGPTRWGVAAWAAAASLFHLYTAGYGVFEPRVQRSLHLLFLVPLIFVLYRFRTTSPRSRPSAWDWLWVVASFVASAYLIWDSDRINHRWEGASDILPREVVLGTVMVVLVVEACRRSLSRWMAVTISVALFYLATCQWFPGAFHYKGFTYPRMIELLYLGGDDGMYGFLTGISSNILFIYVLFGAVLMKAGVGTFLIALAERTTGWMRGGPAKTAVVGSALFGTISGSTVANVYATGSFTIPLMKRGGYSAKTAAAIEAIAGTGGQIMPPVMGAGAFIMSEMTNVPYFEVAKAAAIPAILYYVGLMAMVHFLAVRHGLQPRPRGELPSWGTIFRQAYLALPFVGIVYFLAAGYSPTGAAFYVIVITAVSAATIAVALAGSGMIVGVLTRTGSALAFGGAVLSASMGSLLVAMILIFLVVSVLGTGIPTTAAYVISVVVGAGAMGGLGVPVLAAHLFVFYYAVLSDLTPPDAVTAFAAANIAGSEMMATGLEAFRLGIAGFLVPFAFVFHPELLLRGTWGQILEMSAFAAVSAIALAAAIVGQAVGRLLGWERLLALGTAGLMIVSDARLQSVGALAFVGLVAWSARRRALTAVAPAGG
ncbi:MAG: hypothetical protein AUH18_11490 [Candidatus Rokubacteria bacterium 13_2_20CM_69_10]|nr:MAG: hypothetical protein AUH18_11490 [Candidatus Rokubacteria bacterium 13_2_20CM_69_10]